MPLKDTYFLWNDVDTPAVHPPVDSRHQVLPFGELSWENFERLCYRLAHYGRNVEDVRIYGTAGQAQDGIDLFVRRATGEYETWQCKKYQEMTVSDIAKAVTKFLDGDWAPRTQEFRLAVAPSLKETSLVDEIEKQRMRCNTRNISLVILDADRLSREMKDTPALVDDFFGRAWVESFNGPEAAASLRGRKLSREQRLQARKWLFDLYGTHIQLADPGIPAGAPQFKETVRRVSIAERYIEPSVDLVESVLERDAPSPGGATLASPTPTATGFRRRDVRLKMPLSAAVTANERFLLIGGAGFGKSAALRVLLLDLLGDRSRFPEIAKAWGDRLPLLVPFSFLTAHFKDAAEPSVEACLQAWLRSLGARAEVLTLLTEGVSDDRLLLLIDGLDEWQHQEPAVAALTSLVTFTQTRRIALLATSRPAGFDRIAELGPDWKRANLLPLDIRQQRHIANQWLRHFHETEAAATGGAMEQAVNRDVQAFMAELSTDAGLQELSSVPLLLSVMIYLRLTGQALPHSRLDAVEKLVTTLIVEQPRRRAQAAMIREESSARRSQYVRRGLACLAFRIHEAPNSLALSVERAGEVLRNYFRHEEDLPLAEAENWTERVLDLGRNDFGILVPVQQDHVGLLHRVFQEYLAALYVSRFSLERTKKFCATHARRRAWHDVTVLLLQMLERPGDVDELIELLRGPVDDVLDEPVQKILLTRLGVAALNCSRGKSRALVMEAFDWIERGIWMPLRVTLVREIVHGLESEAVRDLVLKRMHRWFPGRVWFWHDLAKQLAQMPNAETLPALLAALHNADSPYEIRSVAEGLSLCRDAPGTGLPDYLLQVVRSPGEPELVAGALHALALGWPSLDGLDRLLEAASLMPAEEIRRVAVLARFRRGDQSLAIRDALVSFCRDQAHLWPWKDDILEALAAGWGADPQVRQSAMAGLEMEWPRVWNSKLALNFLLRAGAGDDAVAQVIADQLALDRNDRRALEIHDEYELLLAGFKGHRFVVPAAEAWLEKAENVRYNPLETAVVAQLAGTEKARQYLVNWLKRGDGMPAWIIPTLLEMSPARGAEVTALLLDYVADKSRRNESARWLPEIIADRAELLAALQEIMRDGDLWAWLHALTALVDLEGRDAPGLWTSVEEKLQHDTQGHYWRLGHSVLVKVWPDYPLIRQKTKENIYGKDILPGNFLEAYHADPEIRPLIDVVIRALHPDLRVELARALEPLASRGVSGAAQIVAGYQHEPDSDARTYAARAYAKVCRGSEAVSTALTAAFARDLARYDIGESGSRQAAVTGLLELGRADLVVGAREDGRPVKLDTYAGATHNWIYTSALVDHWEELSAVAPDLWTRFDHSGALVAELVKAGKRAAAEGQTTAYENHFRDGKQVDDDEVRALIALHGRSEFLRDLFVARLLRFSPVGTENSMMVMESRTYHAIGTYLAENFRGDPAVHEAMVKVTRAGLVHDVGMIAICRGWPDSPILKPFVDKLGSLLDGTEPITAWVFATKANADLMADYLLRYPRKLRRDHFGEPREGLPAIRTRLEADAECRHATFERLRQEIDLDTIVVVAKLLGPAMSRDATFRDWVREKVIGARKDSAPLAPFAFDALANEVISVEFGLLQSVFTR